MTEKMWHAYNLPWVAASAPSSPFVLPLRKYQTIRKDVLWIRISDGFCKPLILFSVPSSQNLVPESFVNLISTLPFVFVSSALPNFFVYDIKCDGEKHVLLSIAFPTQNSIEDGSAIKQSQKIHNSFPVNTKSRLELSENLLTENPINKGTVIASHTLFISILPWFRKISFRSAKACEHCCA